MKYIAILAAACLSIAAYAEETNPDAMFFKQATEASLAEIAAGDLVQRQSDNAALKDLAATMVRDYTEAMRALASLAASKEVVLPPIASDAQNSALTTLRGLTGVPFDKSYIGWQIVAHRDAIALFKTESTNGDDLEARQFALATLPTLQKHLDHLLSITTEPPAAAQ